MAHETVRGRRASADHDSNYVSAVAGEAADRGVVLEYGNAGADWVVLRDGDCAADFVLRDGVCGAAGVVAVSEPV